MNPTRTTLAVAVLGALTTIHPTASAQQPDATTQEQELKQIQQELKQEISDLKQEMAALKAEFQALRGELTRTVAAIRSAQQAAKQPPAPQPQRPAMSLLGQKGPEWTVTTIHGQKTKIAGKRDKPQVLFCYASWCGFCKTSLPWIESLHQKYKDKGVEVLAVNLDDRGEGGRARTEEQTTQQYRDLKLTLPMTMTTSTNDTKQIGTAYKAFSFPTLFVLGTSGDVEAVHIGAIQGLEDIVGKELDLLLTGKTRADFPG